MMKRKCISISILFILLFTHTNIYSNHNFIDLKTHWAVEEISVLSEKGIISGYEDSTFRPNDDVWLDAFIKMLVVSQTFNPINGTDYWAEPYIAEGLERNYFDLNDFDSYNRPITRNEMAYIITNALSSEVITIDQSIIKNMILDYDLIPTKYKEGVLKAYSLGLLTGYSDGSFKGSQTLSRAESAIVIMRAIDSSYRTEINLGNYPVVDTGQNRFFSNVDEITQPTSSSTFYGQDAQYTINSPSYQDNGDGTITDLVTGLMWQKNPGDKVSYMDGINNADAFDLAGYSDWRVPTIKELYSLIDFNGAMGPTENSPFIDTDYFDFKYGDTSIGEREIDSQYITNTIYVGTTMNGQETMFGVNFADGRIKGYPTNKSFHMMYVRGNINYGKNILKDNQDGTISDLATSLMWMEDDSGFYSIGARNDGTVDWEDALKWANEMNYAGHSDWRLPNAKELQSIVDYSRSPQTTDSPAIDPLFKSTSIIDEGNNENYAFYWSSTTHHDGHNIAAHAVYISFGEALGDFSPRPNIANQIMDVHGAGAQRSDPKIESLIDQMPEAPQGDIRRVYNMVRLVRNID